MKTNEEYLKELKLILERIDELHAKRYSLMGSDLTYAKMDALVLMYKVTPDFPLYQQALAYYNEDNAEKMYEEFRQILQKYHDYLQEA